jgi:GTP-binding protein
MLTFKEGRFVTSALKPEEFPLLKTPSGKIYPELALVGRSNVGKSSLINALFQNASLAKISSTPGKTQRILFFEVDRQALLVDLPGYGYARAPKEKVNEWSLAIDEYLNQRSHLRLLVLLVDVRREFSKEDIALQNWATMKKIPLLLVFTKSDKLSATEKRHLKKEGILFSKKDLESRFQLIQALNRALV